MNKRGLEKSDEIIFLTGRFQLNMLYYTDSERNFIWHLDVITVEKGEK